jgi:hypothetical protein
VTLDFGEDRASENADYPTLTYGPRLGAAIHASVDVLNSSFSKRPSLGRSGSDARTARVVPPLVGEPRREFDANYWVPSKKVLKAFGRPVFHGVVLESASFANSDRIRTGCDRVVQDGSEFMRIKNRFGTGGRRFKSSRPGQNSSQRGPEMGLFCCTPFGSRRCNGPQTGLVGVRFATLNVTLPGRRLLRWLCILPTRAFPHGRGPVQNRISLSRTLRTSAFA